MKSLTVKIPDALQARLAAACRHRGVSQSSLLREALQAHLSGTNRRNGATAPTCYDLAADLIGSLDGPTDLSANVSHLGEYGQ